MTSTDDLVSRSAALKAIQGLRHAAAGNFGPGYRGAEGVARIDSFYDAYRAVQALPAVSSPTPDGVIKERGEEGRDPSGPGSQASPGTPTGCRPEGFDPSRLMTAKWLDPQCISNGCQSLLWHERYQDACRGRREFREAFRRVRRQLRELGRARDQRAEREDAQRPRPEAASPARAAEAPKPHPHDPIGERGAIPEGYVLLPREPTQAMWAAFRDADATGITFDRGYRAMIEAAPRPSQREE